MSANSIQDDMAPLATKKTAQVVLLKELAVEQSLEDAKTKYIELHPQSHLHYQKALQVMPGGNTRSVLHNEPFPIYMKKGAGNRLWDCDDNEYIDLVGELTAGLYGHSNPILQDVLLSTYQNVGVSFGASTAQEIDLASVLCERFPSLERVRFCNSGTEANLYALTIARHITGRRKAIAFQGGYHGGLLNFGHGVAPNTVDKDDWILGEYNNAESAEELIQTTTGVAAVIVEAMQGAGGCIPGTTEFLQTVQKTAQKCGIVFILDEVMTSRLHPHGLQSKYSLSPDITTLGKYIGGGLAFGAFGGKEHLMTAYDPRLATSLPHSGTFNNNTLAMSCGFVGLSKIYTPQVAEELNLLGDYFREQLDSIAAGTKLVVSGVGAVLTIHFLASGLPPVRASDIEEQSISGLKKLFWYFCLDRGYWTTERGTLSVVLGTTKEELDSFVDVVRSFVGVYSHLVKL